MTNREMNTSIKNQLKETGYNIKDFSVSVKDCGYSTSIKVTIKSPYINRKEIETLLSKHQSIDKDIANGEILEGGNTYIFVEYQYGIFETVAYKEWSATAMGLMKEKKEIIRIFDGLYLLSMNGTMEIRQQNEKCHATRCCDFGSLCEYIFKFAHFGTIAA